jgi:hypothetical protein
MTPKQAVERARELLGLGWAADEQAEKAVGIVETIAKTLTEPEGFLRTAQVLWVSERVKDVTGRPSVQRVLGVLREHLPTLVKRDESLGWAQAVAWAALRVDEDNSPDRAAAMVLARSATEWSSMTERQRHLLQELLRRMSTLNEAAYAQEPHRGYEAFNDWPSEKKLNEEKVYKGIQQQLDQANGNVTNVQNAVALLQGITAKNYNVATLQLRALREAVNAMETCLVEGYVPRGVADQLDLLWWGQSLYSRSLQVSYRDVPREALLFWMVEDMSALSDPAPAESKSAYCTETLRKLLPGLDERMPIREHAKQFLHAVAWGAQHESQASPQELPDWMNRLVDEEPTGLPISYLVRGALLEKAPERLLDGLANQIGVDLDQEASSRTWARWVYRERCFVRYLSERWTRSVE